MPRKSHSKTEPKTDTKTEPVLMPNPTPKNLTETERTAWNGIVAFVNAQKPMTEDERKRHERRVALVDESVRENGIRYALAYFSGKKPSVILRELGIDWGVISMARIVDEDIRRATDYGQAERRRIISAKAEERLEMMVDGEISERDANAKAVMFALERLNRASYADERGRRVDDVGGGNGGAQVVYNINISQSPIAPKECANSATAPRLGEIIDVK